MADPEYDDGAESQVLNANVGGWDWQSYCREIRGRLWLVLLVFAIAVAAMWVRLGRTPPAYKSTAVLIIEQKEDQVMRMQSVAQTDLVTPDFINTIVETIRSRTLLERVVDSLNLQDNPDFLPKKVNGTAYTKQNAVDALASAIKVTPRPKTRLVDIMAESSSPEMARMLADAVATEFIRLGYDQRANSNRFANEYLIEEAAKLRDKLRQSEEALQNYRETNNATSLEGNQNIILDQLKDMNASLSRARAERFGLETDQAKAREVAGQPAELLKIPSIAKLPTVASLVSAIAAKESELALLSQEYKPKHPKYIEAVTEIQNLKENLNKKVLEGGDLIASGFRAAKENEERLGQAVHQQEKLSSELNQKAIDYNVLKRELETDQAIYDSVLARVKETDVTKGIDISPIKLMENATTPLLPDDPRRVQKLVQAGILGLAIGIALSLASVLLSPGFTNIAQAEHAVGLPVLSVIPAGKNKRSKVLDESKGLVAEAFRSLRTALCLLGREEDRRSFLVTSAIPDEGKTFISSHLAMSFAQGGMTTLLIDADLRKPSVSDIFFKKQEQPGLTELLADRASFQDAIRPSGIENLSVLTAGQRAPNPAELLTQPGMKAIIKTALQTFDRVVIDTAPILAVSDTLMIAGEVQTVCFVARYGTTARSSVVRARKSLANAGKVPSGIIINRMPIRSGAYYGYYGYYGAKAVYGEKEATS